jgi:MFS family permease
MRTDLLTSPETSGPIFSLDEILEKIPIGFFHYRLLVVCGMSFMADAMEVTLLSFISACAGSDWDLADSEIALIASIVFVGVLVGSLFWGPFADHYGRRYAFIFGAARFTLILILWPLTSCFCRFFNDYCCWVLLWTCAKLSVVISSQNTLWIWCWWEYSSL